MIGPRFGHVGRRGELDRRVGDGGQQPLDDIQAGDAPFTGMKSVSDWPTIWVQMPGRIT